MSRTLVEVEITRANQVIIKGLPVLINPVAEHKCTPVGYYWIQATPIDFVMDIGDEFKIANQLRPWKLDKIKVNKYGKRVAYFEKYGDRGNRIESFYMVDGEKYLFADTSGSARNGVVHKYREPKTELEKLFYKKGWGRSQIETVDKIDAYVYDGGRWCHHMVNDGDKYWCVYATDGKKNIDLSTDGTFVEHSSNQYHIGCMQSPARHKIEGGTYLVEVEKRWNQSFCHIYKTIDADENQIIKEIENLVK